MPIYVYEEIRDDGTPGEQFEICQSMADEPLKQHPQTGKPVRRVLQAPFIGGQWSDSAMAKSVSDDKQLERLGFTKYVKSGDGKYEKTIGSGPSKLSADAPKLPD
jgi:predicted nucleic acid-binding Zn ribbon protein